MPLKNGNLTPRERAFAVTYAQTEDGAYAAAKAGYKHPHANAAKLLQRPTVAAAVFEQQTAILENELLPLAVAAHRRLLTDKSTPAGALVNAVRLCYDRTLGAQVERHEKEAHELSAQELADAIARLECLKVERARPVIDGEVIVDVFD